MTINDIKKYLSDSRIVLDNDTLVELAKMKLEAKKYNDEKLANEIWCLEEIFSIQSTYIDAFEKMKKHDFFNAWCLLERVDIDISCLNENNVYSEDTFNLDFIGTIIVEYEKLFPYEWFFSREAIVKKKRCSICDTPITLRKCCEHEVGKIYMGELCVSKIEDIEYLAGCLVRKPFDKYTVLMPQEEVEYNYFMLENLMPILNSPYDKWSCQITIIPNPEYKKIGRNDKCPCGSTKKFKYCCLKTNKVYLEHHEVLLHDNPNAKSIPLTLGSRLKMR